MIIILEDKPGNVAIWISDDWYVIEHNTQTRESYITLMTETERFRSGFNESPPRWGGERFPQNWILS